MDAGSKSHRVPVVVFDDGSLTRSGLERVARYASDADLLGGVRGPALARLLEGLGVPVRDLGAPAAVVATAAETAASRGAVLVTGVPLDGPEWITALGLAAQGTGRCGLVSHVPDAGSTGTVRAAALTPAAASWANPLGGAFGSVAGLHAEAAAARIGTPPAAAAELLELSGTDRLFIWTADPYPEPVPASAPPTPYALNAADTVLAVVTDSAVEVTNRSPVAVRVRVRLGAAGESGEDLGSVEAELEPHGSFRHPLAESRFLAGLEPPAAVVRHWSHETETVYEGGTIRINGLDLRFLDPAGTTIGLGSYGTRQGLHVGVNSPELGAVLGSSLTSVADEYARMSLRRPAALADLLALLAEPRERTVPAPASQPN